MATGSGAGSGCGECRATDPDPHTAWLAWRDRLGPGINLVDDSHFIVSIRRCATCAQHYLSIFTEAVDWTGGEDSQHRIIIAVTAAEAAALAQRRGDLDLAALGELGRDRRYLVVDWPTEARDQRVYWSSGQFHIAPGH